MPHDAVAYVSGKIVHYNTKIVISAETSKIVDERCVCKMCGIIFSATFKPPFTIGTIVAILVL